ncbi:hypothetical protein THAOC_20129 [Thalassiosira oceanica]|uniref:Uncharacterized protein n=1 Tax=Thalassiosira oceanica TaxID=159749 RepID=K0SF94_THAOC|nr:hypothetical protein THAOC_20129 [Thalassiosira oceanica]|eukprot:EJK59616.1 hypothetical protein THAOC_20129 [Thalassiosira oceanica]
MQLQKASYATECERLAAKIKTRREAKEEQLAMEIRRNREAKETQAAPNPLPSHLLEVEGDDTQAAAQLSDENAPAASVPSPSQVSGTVEDHEVHTYDEAVHEQTSLEAAFKNEAASHSLHVEVEGDDTQAVSQSPLEEVEGDSEDYIVSVSDDISGPVARSFVEDTFVSTGVVEGHETHSNDEATYGQATYEVSSTDKTESQSLLGEVEGDDMAEEPVRLENSVRPRDDEVVGLQATVTRLQGDLECLRHDVTSITTQRDALKSQLESRDEDVARLQEQLTRLLGDLESAKATNIQAPTKESSSSGDAESPPVQVVFDEDGQVTKPVSDALHGASWASVCEEDEENDARDTARRDISRTNPLGAWAVPPQLKGIGDTSALPPALPQQVAPPRITSSSRGDNDVQNTTGHSFQAKHVAIPRYTSSSRGDEVRILQRPAAPTIAVRATTDTPRLRALELCAPSRSVVQKTMRKSSRRRKGASTDNTPRQKNDVAPASRGVFVSQQQACLAVQACNNLNMQLGRDRDFFYKAIGHLRAEVARLQTGRSNEAEDISESPGDNQSPVDSRGAYNEAFTAATVLETIPEESTALAVTSSTAADDRCTSDGDSSDALRKRIGSPSESVQPTDATPAQVSTFTRDNRVATDVLSSDEAPLRQLLTKMARPSEGVPVEEYHDDAFEQAAPPDDKALLSPTAVEGDADSSNGTVFDQAAPPTDVTVLHSHSMVGGNTKRGGDDIHRSTLQGDKESDDAFRSIELSTSDFNEGMRDDVHPLQYVLAAPVLAFQLAPASSDNIFRQIDTNNRLESQDEGLPPKPKRKRRRHRRRRRKRGRKKTTRDLLIHSPMTHPQEFRAVFNSAATKSLPLSGFDGPGDTSMLTYTTSRQPDPLNNATRSKFPTIKNADKSFSSASPLDISRAKNDTVSCTLSSVARAADPRGKPRPAAEDIFELSCDKEETQASHWPAEARTTANKPGIGKSDDVENKRTEQVEQAGEQEVIEILSSDEENELREKEGDTEDETQASRWPAAGAQVAAEPQPQPDEDDEDVDEEIQCNSDAPSSDYYLLAHCQRITAGADVPLLLPASKPAGSTSSEEEYLELAKGNYNARASTHGRLAFETMRRATPNAIQNAVLWRYLDLCEKCFIFLVDRGYALVPGGTYYDCIDITQFTINNNNPHVYLIDLETGPKVGLCGVGTVRLLYYMAFFHERGLPLPDIVSLVDLGHLPQDIQLQLVKMMLEGVKQFAPERLPTTVREAVGMCSTGLPIHAQYLFYTLTTSLEECVVFGGGIEMRSFLLRLVLMMLESVTQKYLDVPNRAKHEGVSYCFLGCCGADWRIIVADIRVFFGKFATEEFSVLLSRPWRFRFVLMSWQVGLIKGCLELLKWAKPMVYGVIFSNKSDPVPEDTFTLPPVEDPRSVDECYAKKNFTPEDRKKARAVILSRLTELETCEEGGMGCIDTNKDAMDGKCLLDRGDKKLRLLFVCPPFCFPLFWSPKLTSISFDTLETKRPTVMVVQWMILVVRVLATESAKLAFSFLDEKVSGCFLFIWYIIYAGMGQFGKVFAGTLAVAAKNMMDMHVNNFGPRSTQLRRTGAGEGEDRRSLHLVSANARSQLNDPKRAKGGDSGVEHDRNYQRRLASTLSTAGFGVSSEDAVSLVFDRVGEGLDGDSSAAGYRRSSLMESGIIFNDAHDAVKEYHVAHRRNSGRRGKGRVVVTSGQCETNDLNLAEIIWYGLDVWVVTEDGATPPQDGTLITNKHNATGKYYWKDCEEEAESKEFRYSHDESLDGMTYNGLVRRTKGQNLGSKTTQKFKGIPFVDYRVVQPLNYRVNGGQRTKMSNPDGSGKSKFQTDQKVTKIKFVWTKDGTEEDRLRELEELLAKHGCKYCGGEEED